MHVLWGEMSCLSFWWKISALLPFDPDWAPQHQKMCPPQRTKKNWVAYPAKFISCHIIKTALYMKYGKSPKVGSKVMKPALEYSFYLKIKNESNHLIGKVGMIETLSSKLHSFIVFVIIQKLLWLVLICVDYWRIYRVHQKLNSKFLHLSQKCTQISKNGQERVQ